MRLERLEIGGFGRLSDVDLELHPRLTVILGPNESGKSTIHRALRAALYGIDAGGPGRPTDRSDWARWAPWNGDGYGLALSYELSDGRRIRVARRLQQREHTCQVHEIGGGDVTAEVRIGRAVAPGAVHLGIDEAVFCATACVGEDGLHHASGEGPSARASEVQEAIERIADSGAEVTAAQALAAITHALNRVGSERRASSPLGHAVNRLRQLEVQVDDARRRLAALAAEEERLRTLEADAEEAERRRRDAERRWLVGRLASLAAQRADLESTAAELRQVAAEVEGNQHLAAFPLDAEERVLSAAAHLTEARRSADEAEARAAASAETLAGVRRRRAEIDAGLRALGSAAAIDDAAAADAADLQRRLAETVTARSRGEELSAAVARREALRREIAATGIAATSSARVEAAIDLVAAARGGRSSRAGLGLATAVLVAGTVAAAVSLVTRHGLAALVAGGVALLAAAAVVGMDRLVAGEAKQAVRRLARLFPGMTLDGDGLERLAERLPRLGALHEEVRREEVRIETLSSEIGEADRQLAALAERAVALLERCELPPPRRARGSEGSEDAVRAALAAVAGHVGIGQRRSELHAEDVVLAERERSLGAVAADAEVRRAAVGSADSHLRRILDNAGVDRGLPPLDAVAAFRAACEGRRRHDAAARRLTELRRRASSSADSATLRRLAGDLERRLAARGGDPADVDGAEALDHARLADLEAEAEHARQGAVAASTAAAALRARLGELRGSAPPLADLEDERAACIGARDRAVEQLAALRRAAQLIEAATKTVHRDLAPRLAASVADRLTMITEGRYTAVNIDTGHFEVSLLGRDRLDLVPLALASHGTRDQVALLLRLAIAEVLSGGGEPIPLLLDEPLLSSDPRRRETALRFLWNVSATNQVVVSTSDPTLVDCLEKVCDGEEPAVVTMDSLDSTFEATGRIVAMAKRL